jgi:hypothetical protein
MSIQRKEQVLPRGSEGVKKSKQLTQSRKGTKKRKAQPFTLLCGLCVLCAFA